MINKDISESKSDTFQEILSELPHWILRWGPTVISIVLVVLIMVSSFFKYPDTLNLNIRLTNTTSKETVIAKFQGEFQKIYVENNEMVHKNKILGVIANSAEADDIKRLKVTVQNINDNLDSKELLPFRKLKLGATFQSLYDSLSLRMFEYKCFKTKKFLQMLDLEFPKSQFHTGQQYVLVEDLLKKQLLVLIDKLNIQIKIWEGNHSVFAPIRGRVFFSKNWGENQTVNFGENIFNIIPADPGKLIGKALLPLPYWGKVKVGQKANIQIVNLLKDSPEILTGVVKKISIDTSSKLAVNAKYHTLDIEVFQNTESVNKTNLSLSPGIEGKAEIILSDVSMLDKLISYFKISTSKSKF